MGGWVGGQVGGWVGGWGVQSFRYFVVEGIRIFGEAFSVPSLLQDDTISHHLNRCCCSDASSVAIFSVGTAQSRVMQKRYALPI